MPERVDVAVIGGGIVGLATAMAIVRERACSVAVLEAEPQIGTHQTGRNSGVIHSGIYYKPGSLKAALCTQGAAAMYEFCTVRGIPFERCGKLIVATAPHEVPRLDELESRGRANGLQGIRRLGPEEIRQVEPFAAGIDALHIPAAGITDFAWVAREMASVIEEHGGIVQCSSPLLAAARTGSAWNLITPRGNLQCTKLVNCAGLHSDEVARRCGIRPDVRIIPFRGEYFQLAPDRTSLVRNLIYPVPDPLLPFLGVHFTRLIHGGVEAGPNAVLALARHGYSWSAISPRHLLDLACSSAFWRMSRCHWRTGVQEIRRSFSSRRFLRDLKRLVPHVTAHDLIRPPRGRAGVRAQAVDCRGNLIQDFHFIQHDDALHILNAPSPAATASIAIGERIARQLFATSNAGSCLNTA